MALPFTLKYIFNKWFSRTLIVLIQGSTQTGKSTVLKAVCDTLYSYRYGVDWPHKLRCARSFDELIDYVDKYDNEILAIEEASFYLSSDEWQNIQNRLFSQINFTQAYKHNLIFLVLPHSKGIAKAHRRMIDMGLTVKKKIEGPRPATLIYPLIYKRIYWKLEENAHWNLFLPQLLLRYSDEQMKRCKDFTDNFLVDYKKSIMEQIKTRWQRHKSKHTTL